MRFYTLVQFDFIYRTPTIISFLIVIPNKPFVFCSLLLGLRRERHPPGGGEAAARGAGGESLNNAFVCLVVAQSCCAKQF
jgi:hypothetical protein